MGARTLDIGVSGDSPVLIDFDAPRWREEGLRAFVCGASGSGKGWTWGVWLEELHQKAGLPVVVIDPESEAWTFQEIGALVVGGPHADAPLVEDRHLIDRLIRHALATSSMVVFDLGGERRRRRDQAYLGNLIAGVMWDVMDEVRAEIVLGVTEAHHFAPEQLPKALPGEDTSRTPDYAIMAEFASAGRKRGVTLALETQRPASISKQVVDLCNVRMIGRLDGLTDFDALKRHLPPGIGSNEAERFQHMQSLSRGDFYMTGWPVPVHVRMRRVTHGGGSPAERPEAVERPADPSAATAELVELLLTYAAKAEESAPTAAVDVTRHLMPGPSALEQSGRAVDGVVRDLEATRTELADAREHIASLVEERSGEELMNEELTERLTAAEQRVRELEAERLANEPAVEFANALRRFVGAHAGTGETVVSVGVDAIARLEERIEERLATLDRSPIRSAALRPAEALRSGFREEAAQRLISKVTALDEDARRAFLFLIAQAPESQSISAVTKGITGNTAGPNHKKYARALHELERIGLLVESGKGGTQRFSLVVDEFVREGLGAHNPTAEELEAVRDRALSVLMGA